MINKMDNFKNKIEYSPLLSVIVINYNGIRYLGNILDDCIKSILESDFYNFELIIVDNGSSDGSVEHLKSRFGHDSRFKIIALEENLGTTGGKNIGIKSSKGKYVFVLNNDLYLKKQTLTKMIKIMEENEDIGILSCKLITPKGELQSEGEFFTYKHSLLKAVTPTLLEKVNKNKIIKNRVDGLNQVDWMVGAALMLKKDLIIKLNLYDEYFFMYSEEIDLAFRVKQAGYKVACLNNYEIIHYGNVTASHFSTWRRDLLARNLLLYIMKNYSNVKLVNALLIYFLEIFRHFFHSLISFNELEWKIAYSEIKAFSYVKKPAKPPS